MSQFTTATDYFDLAVMKNIKRDIEYLLKKDDCPSGPLLTCAMNAIDVLGGVVYGFVDQAGHRNSTDRSRDFMVNMLGMHLDVAGFLYDFVRNGMAHEANPKSTGTTRVGFWTLPQANSDSHVFFVGQHAGSDCICLDVRALANAVLNAIEYLEDNRHLVQHFPPAPSDRRFQSARNALPASSTPDIAEFDRRRGVVSPDPSGVSGAPAIVIPPSGTP